MFRTLRLPGFTMIEILTVIAIIGVISLLSIGPIRAAQMRGRDAQRKNDVNLIAQALDLYYSENRSLPGQEGTGACKDTFTSKADENWIPALSQRYLPSTNGKVLPLDPSKKSVTYYYTYINYLCMKERNPGADTDGQSFKVQAILENENDSDAVSDDDGNIVYEVVR